MSDDAQQPLLSPLGEYRPSRADDASESSGAADAPQLGTGHLLTGASDNPSPDATTTSALPLSPPDPEIAPATAVRRPLGDMVLILVACCAHLALMLILVSTPPVEFGYGGSHLDAVSVSIIPANAIYLQRPSEDASQLTRSPIAPTSAEDSAASEALPEREAPRAPKPEKIARDVELADEQLAAPLDAAPESAPEEADTIKAASSQRHEPEIAAADPPQSSPRPEKPQERARDTAATSPAPAATASGDATARDTALDQPVRASPGEIDAYGSAVQSALLAVDQREARARASAMRAKGTVVVRLAIDRNGALMSAEVVRSSGRRDLDDAALQLIRLATFPRPPASLADAERAYLAPIRFR